MTTPTPPELLASFDPSKVLVSQLRGILLLHSIPYPPTAKKQQLIQLFEQHLRPIQPRLLQEYLQVQPSTRGIKEGTTTSLELHELDTSDEEGEGDTAMDLDNDDDDDDEAQEEEPEPVTSTRTRTRLRKSQSQPQSQSQSRRRTQALPRPLQPPAPAGTSSSPPPPPASSLTHTHTLPRTKKRKLPSTSQYQEEEEEEAGGAGAFSDYNPFQSGAEDSPRGARGSGAKKALSVKRRKSSIAPPPPSALSTSGMGMGKGRKSLPPATAGSWSHQDQDQDQDPLSLSMHLSSSSSSPPPPPPAASTSSAFAHQDQNQNQNRRKSTSAIGIGIGIGTPFMVPISRTRGVGSGGGGEEEDEVVRELMRRRVEGRGNDDEKEEEEEEEEYEQPVNFGQAVEEVEGEVDEVEGEQRQGQRQRQSGSVNDTQGGSSAPMALLRRFGGRQSEPSASSSSSSGSASTPLRRQQQQQQMVPRRHQRSIASSTSTTTATTPQRKKSSSSLTSRTSRSPSTSTSRTKPKTQARAAQRFAWWSLVLLLVAYGAFWREEKLAVGFCSSSPASSSSTPHTTTTTTTTTTSSHSHSHSNSLTLSRSLTHRPLSLSSTPLSSLRVPLFLLPSCTPCPSHGLCSSSLGTFLGCEPSFVPSPHPLHLGGLLPLPLAPRCVPDTAKLWAVANVASGIKGRLKKVRGGVVCAPSGRGGGGGGEEERREKRRASFKGSGSGDGGGGAGAGKGKGKGEKEAWVFGMEGAQVLREVHEANQASRAPLKDDFLEEVARLALKDLEAHGEVMKWEEGSEIYYATHEADLPLSCRARLAAVKSAKENKTSLLSLVGAVLALLYGKFKLARSKEEGDKVRELVKTVLGELRKQEYQHHLDPALAPHPHLAQSHLRDFILQHVHSPARRQRLWRKVEKVVEGNANVRAKQVEHQGEELRAWEWIGQGGLGAIESQTPRGKGLYPELQL